MPQDNLLEGTEQGLKEYLTPSDSPAFGMNDIVNSVRNNVTSRRDTAKTPSLFDTYDTEDRQKDHFSALFMDTAPKKASFEGESFRVQDAYDRLSDGTYVKKYDTFTPGIDNNEKFAQEQTTGEKWNHGIKKFFGKTGTAILGSTVGSVVGLAEAVVMGDWTAVYDNDFNNTMDDWNKRMDNGLANYYTEEERDKSFLQSMGTANFWANDFLGGLSFTVGAIAGEAIWAAATGGASLGVRAARMALRAGNTAESAVKATTSTAKLARLLKQEQSVMKDYLVHFNKKQIADAVLAGKTVAGLNQARMIYTSAGYEAGVEARMYMQEARENFDLTFEEMNGRPPTNEDRAMFESTLRSTANTVFAVNLGLVGSSNLAMYGKMFNMKNPLKTPGKMFRNTVFGGGVKFGEKGVAKAAQRNIAQRVAGTSYSVLRGPFIEGVWEEGIQGVTGTAAGAYLESTYGDNDEVMGLMESVYEGLSHTYGTKEGFKEVGLGMLIGLVGGGGSKIMSGQNPLSDTIDAGRKISKRDAEVAKILNTYSSKKLVNEMYRARLIEKANREADDAETSGDLVHAQAARSMGMMANIIYANRMGYGEEVMAEMKKALEGMDVKAISENLGITEAEAVQMKEDSLTEYMELRDMYSKNLEFSEYVIGAGKIDSKTINHEIAREALAYQMTMSDKFKDVTEDYSKAIMAEVGDNTSYGYQLQEHFKVQNILRKATKKDRENFNNTRKEYRALSRELARLEKKRRQDEIRVNQRKLDPSRGANIDMVESLDSTNNAIIAAEERLVELENQLEGAYSAMSLYAIDKAEEGYISGKDLADADKNLENVEKYFENLEHTNPEKAARIKVLVEGYRNSITSARLYSEVVEDLMNPETGLKGSTRTFLTKLKKYNDPTQRLVDNLTLQQKLFATGAEGMFGEFEGDTQQSQEGESEEGSEEAEGADIVEDTKDAPDDPDTPPDAPPAEPPSAQPNTEATDLTSQERERIEKEFGVVIEDNVTGSAERYHVEGDQNKQKKAEAAIAELESKKQKELGELDEESSKKGNKETEEDAKSRMSYSKTQGGINVVNKGNSRENFNDFRAEARAIGLEDGSGVGTVERNGKKYRIASVRLNISRPDIREFISRNSGSQRAGNVYVAIEITENTPDNIDQLLVQEAIDTAKEEFNFIKDWDGAIADESVLNDILNTTIEDSTSGTKEVSKEEKAKQIIDRYNKQIEKLKEDTKDTSDVQGARQEIANLQGAKRAKQQAKERTEEAKRKEEERGLPNFTQKIQELTRKKNYILQNFGEDTESMKPTEEEVQRYEELLSKFNIDPTTIIGQSINTISKRGLKKIGLTKAEVTEFKELNDRFSNWRLLDGVGEGDTSLAEVIEQKMAYDKEVKPDEVSELTESEELAISNGVRNAANSDMTSEMVNSPEVVMIRKAGKVYEISHLKFQDLVDKGAVIKKNGNEITDFEGAQKGVYTVEFGDVKIPVSLEAHQRINVGTDLLNTLFKEAGLSTFSLVDTKGSSWGVMYEMGEDGVYTPMDSNFTITEEGSEINILDPQALYDLKPGDDLFFKLSITDSFNTSMKQEYMDAKERYDRDPSTDNTKALNKIKDEIYEQVSIYVVSSNNDVVGNLKGIAEDVESTPKFKAIRRHAAEILFEKYDRDTAVVDYDMGVESGEVRSDVQTMYSLPFTSKVSAVFVGSPNLTVEVNEAGEASVKRNKFSDTGLKMVSAYGIVENGQIQANESTPIDRTKINTQFIDKIDKATPFVVINYENQRVAYPISVKAEQRSLHDTVAELYETTESNGELAAKLIETLAENGVDPSEYNIRHIGDDTFFGTEDEANMIKDLENTNDVVSKEEFLSKDYDKTKLQEQGEISIRLDNRPFLAPKIKADLKGTMLYTREAQIEEIARFNITGVAENITKESIANQLLSKKKSELSAFHKKVLSLHGDEIQKMVDKKVELSEKKAAESSEELGKKCNDGDSL